MEALAPVYSNRSAAFLKVNKLKQALADAKTCCELRPNWEKGWYRAGMAHEALAALGGDGAAVERAGAEKAYNKASELAPQSAELAQKSKPKRRSNKPGRAATASQGGSFSFPDAVPREAPKGERAWSTDELGRGDAAWLAATRAPSQLKGEDIGQAPEFVAAIFKAGEAVNAMGMWLGKYLALAQKQRPGKEVWFYEAPGLVALLDQGLWQALLDALGHVVMVIIGAEAQKGSNIAAAAAEAGAALAQACAGVMHNLLGPSLRAWSARQEHTQLLAAFAKVCATEGTFLTLPPGSDLAQSPEMAKFLMCAGQLLGDAEAYAALTGHAVLTRIRLNLLRAQTTAMRASSDEDKKKWKNEAESNARMLVLLLRVREAGKWEQVAEALCDKDKAKTFHGEVAACVVQHELLAGAWPKFGYSGSVGL